MKTAAFIGHHLHHLTKSSAFFKKLLSAEYALEEFDFDPGQPNAFDYRGLIDKPFDAYFFWQTEHILEAIGDLFNAPVYIIPMYDAAIQRAVSYWRLHANRTFVSFSRSMHVILQSASCDSILVQYYPEPEARSWTSEKEISAFFWERRPEESYNATCVVKACAKLEIQSLHIHLAPDFETDTEGRQKQLHNIALSLAPGLELTFSRWFPDRSDMIKTMSRHPVYFAPRELEGIGMGFLEAMAQGQVVIGPDEPTLNEYIADGHSGLLLNSDYEVPAGTNLTMKSLERMSNTALMDVSRGHAAWLWDQDRLLTIMRNDSTQPEWDSGTSFLKRIRENAGARRLN